MRYLVTGATGFVGGRVARRLREAGHEVVALARDLARAGDLASIGAEVRRGDITDKESLRAPMEGVDGVFHVAGWYRFGAKDASEPARINVEGTRNVLELMMELHVPKGVYTSTLAVNSDTHGKVVNETYRYDGLGLTVYDRTKWKAHYEVAEPMTRRGLPLVIVQPGVVYGPGDTSQIRPLFVRYLRRKLRAVPRGPAYSWSYIDDVATGHVLAMDRGRPGESYIIAGPSHSLIEAFDVAERITGIPAPRFRPSPRFLKAIAAITRSERLRVAAGVTYLDNNAKARRELGYDPRSLEAGLRETSGTRWPSSGRRSARTGRSVPDGLAASDICHLLVIPDDNRDRLERQHTRGPPPPSQFELGPAVREARQDVVRHDIPAIAAAIHVPPVRRVQRDDVPRPDPTGFGFLEVLEHDATRPALDNLSLVRLPLEARILRREVRAPTERELERDPERDADPILRASPPSSGAARLHRVAPRLALERRDWREVR